MIPEGAKDAESERYLTRGEVAGRLLASISTVQRWIDEGRLATVSGHRGVRIPERSLLDFQRQAFRRENFNGTDHGLHSWPVDYERTSQAVIPIQDAELAEQIAPRWPFPAAANQQTRGTVAPAGR